MPPETLIRPEALICAKPLIRPEARDPVGPYGVGYGSGEGPGNGSGAGPGNGSGSGFGNGSGAGDG